MKELSKLTPAETLFVLQGTRTTVREVLKYTLMDLLLKQALVVEDVHRQTHARDPITILKYVKRGKNFSRFNQHVEHEDVFMSSFTFSQDNKILFKQLIKVAYEKAGQPQKLQRKIMNGRNLSIYFEQSFFQLVFGGFSYTKQGEELKQTLEKEIAVLEQKVVDLVNNDRKRALEMLKVIGGNIFLLKGLDFTLLQEIDKELLEQLSKDHRTPTSSGCASGCWGGFHDYSNTFDSSHQDGSHSGHDSGCSGDGGGSTSGDGCGSSACSSGCGGGGCGGGD